MLQLINLSLRRGPRLLLEGADLTVYPGHKVGVVGANGCGKSSLFALIRGELQADGGDLLLPPGWVIAHVAQQTPAGDQPAIEFVIDGDRVALRYTWQALHSGVSPNLQIPPSHKTIEIEGCCLIHFEKNRIVEWWDYTDMLGLLTQVGLIPAMT